MYITEQTKMYINVFRTKVWFGVDFSPFNRLHVNLLGAALTAEEKTLLAQAAKERADIIDRYDKVTVFESVFLL